MPRFRPNRLAEILEGRRVTVLMATGDDTPLPMEGYFVGIADDFVILADQRRVTEVEPGIEYAGVAALDRETVLSIAEVSTVDTH